MFSINYKTGEGHYSDDSIDIKWNHDTMRCKELPDQCWLIDGKWVSEGRAIEILGRPYNRAFNAALVFWFNSGKSIVGKLHEQLDLTSFSDEVIFERTGCESRNASILN